MKIVERTPTERIADRFEIQDLTHAYAEAVDGGDWARFEALFVPDAFIDYREAGGTHGTPAEVAAWMPQAMSAFRWALHSMSTHTVVFEDEDHARGTQHVLARQGVEFEGAEEVMDVGAIYEDRYVRTPDGWRFAGRIEHTKYITGGKFAELVKTSLQGAS